jgi:hypothetical protein
MKITGRILATERLKLSRNGNPRFRIMIENHGMYTTSSDASVSYDIDNWSRSGEVVEWTLTRAGRVAYGQVVESN